MCTRKLTAFLTSIPNKLKQISLGQCVTQTARSKSILCPIPFGVGVQLGKTLGSKWLVQLVAHSSQLTNAEEVITEDTNFAQWAADMSTTISLR